MTHTPTPANTRSDYTKLHLFGIAVFIVFMAVVGTIFITKISDKPDVSVISRDGVVTQIQQMARLNTVAFGVDTIITAHKDGTWQKLWQDEQKGLFVAKGRVLAGVDLSKLTADDVTITEYRETYPDNPNEPKTVIHIKLPSSQVFEVFLDDIQVYDWKTGLFGIVDNDPEILKQAQLSAKTEVLKKACQGEIMTIAKDNATEQIRGLFALGMDSNIDIVVHMNVGECKI